MLKKRRLKQFHAKIGPIQIILRNSQIPACYLVTAVVINIHNNDRGDRLTCPSVIPPGFTQTVAGDLARDIQVDRRGANDPPCLHTGNCLLIFTIIGENEIPSPVWKIAGQSRDCTFIERYRFCFSGFLFGQCDMKIECLPFLIVYVRPFES